MCLQRLFSCFAIRIAKTNIKVKTIFQRNPKHESWDRTGVYYTSDLDELLNEKLKCIMTIIVPRYRNQFIRLILCSHICMDMAVIQPLLCAKCLEYYHYGNRFFFFEYLFSCILIDSRRSSLELSLFLFTVSDKKIY